jgi:predicted alpha/beta-hydrolase family hydrolase
VPAERAGEAEPVALGARAGLLLRPAGATRLFVLAPGAGAGMRHPFLAGVAAALARRRVATLRFEFPYQAAGTRRPDREPVLLDAVGAAVAEAARLAAGLPLLAGGKSMGGRMASLAAAAGRLDAAHGLVFLGFPLHPAGRPATARAAHLERVPQRMLFLQGTRDPLADLTLLRPICEKLGERARLHVIEGADHGFHVPKRSGRSHAEVIEELAGEIAGFPA